MDDIYVLMDYIESILEALADNESAKKIAKTALELLLDTLEGLEE